MPTSFRLQPFHKRSKGQLVSDQAFDRHLLDHLPVVADRKLPLPSVDLDFDQLAGQLLPHVVLTPIKLETSTRPDPPRIALPIKHVYPAIGIDWWSGTRLQVRKRDARRSIAAAQPWYGRASL